VNNYLYIPFLIVSSLPSGACLPASKKVVLEDMFSERVHPAEPKKRWQC
jgi:hypothetical protein